MDTGEHSVGTRIMAKRCDTCPACRYARDHSETRFGRVMAWHGTWCPFWKAHERVYGTESSSAGSSSTGGMRAG